MNMGICNGTEGQVKGGSCRKGLLYSFLLQCSHLLQFSKCMDNQQKKAICEKKPFGHPFCSNTEGMMERS